MTASHYAARVTEIIDAATGHAFVYPDNFDSDIAACMQQRLTVQQAADKLLAEYTSEATA